MATSTERARAWREANPEKWREHQNRYKIKNRAPCLRCGEPIPFPSPGRKYHPECSRKVESEADRAKRDELRGELDAYKRSLGCSRCGFNASGAALDFHHPDDNKERRVTVRSWKTALGQAEISKCVLLCANCHRIEHHG